ncbi:MAG: 30S ribosomal protein S6 [Minisyncoccota bacterium]
MVEKEISTKGADRDPVVYEIGFLLLPTIPEEQILDEMNALKSTVESLQALLISDGGTLELLTLAYPMVHTVSNKHTTYESAYFGWIKFHARPESIAALDVALKTNQKLIRYLLVKTIKENTLLPKRFGAPPAKKKEEITLTSPVLTEAEIDKTVDDLISTTETADTAAPVI